ILFFAAGAFHTTKPSDLIPELQGRFPVRVEVDKLTADDFERILKEPSNALLKQYTELLKIEDINIEFTDEEIIRLSEITYKIKKERDNMGARCFNTILEKLIEDLSFETQDINLPTVEITASYVDDKLKEISKNKDVSQFIL